MQVLASDIYIKLCSFYEPKALLSRQAIFEVHCRDFINRHALSDKDYVKVNFILSKLIKPR